MKLYTAQFNYNGSDRIDITAASEDPEGWVFRPTWLIVNDYKKRKDEDFYKKQYLSLMLQSYKLNKQRWFDFLKREEATLVCYCRSGDFCHRLLIANYLRQMGAEYLGER